jgi:hypothetical protein
LLGFCVVYRLGFYVVSLLGFRVERWLGFSADFPENRSLGLAVFTLHVAAGVVWPLALNADAHGQAIHALTLTSDPPILPVAAADLQPAVSLAEVSIPATGGLRTGIRLLTAYWLTMVAAGVFIFGLAMTAQGLAASWLPRRHFLRMSSWLQVAALPTQHRRDV